MTRLAMALIHGESPVAATTFNKKDAPEAPPMIAPKPPVEEASVEIEAPTDKKARTGKSSLKMPILSKNTGLKI